MPSITRTLGLGTLNNRTRAPRNGRYRPMIWKHLSTDFFPVGIKHHNVFIRFRRSHFVVALFVKILTNV